MHTKKKNLRITDDAFSNQRVASMVSGFDTENFPTVQLQRTIIKKQLNQTVTQVDYKRSMIDITNHEQ